MTTLSHLRPPPKLHGRKWIGARLPRASCSWPEAAYDASEGDLSPEALQAYAEGYSWEWPKRRVVFLCDQHADADAFFASLVASGGVRKTGRRDGDFKLTPVGRESCFIIGGDNLDKGPSNLRLLRAVKRLIKKGADVRLLAGNHDLRTLVGLLYAGRKEPEYQHLFVRMGRKTMPLFKEVFDQYLAKDFDPATQPTEEELHEKLFPDESWFEEYPKAVRGLVPDKKIAKEIGRIREKVVELEDKIAALDMDLPKVHAALEKTRELFLTPRGEFSWLFSKMKLAERLGSFLFVHAGVDDRSAEILATGDVRGLNAAFQDALETDPFRLYHGSLGNVFRTKYRDHDFPFRARSARMLREAGIHAIVHGHKSVMRGHRLCIREGLLNFECDVSVDANTRRLAGLEGPGGGALVIERDHCIWGISADHPQAKLLLAEDFLGPRFAPEALFGELPTTSDDPDVPTRKTKRKKKLEYENEVSLRETIVWMEHLLEGLKSGEVLLHNDDRKIALQPGQMMDVEVKASRKKKRQRLSFEFSWKSPRRKRDAVADDSSPE